MRRGVRAARMTWVRDPHNLFVPGARFARGRGTLLPGCVRCIPAYVRWVVLVGRAVPGLGDARCGVGLLLAPSWGWLRAGG